MPVQDTVAPPLLDRALVEGRSLPTRRWLAAILIAAALSFVVKVAIASRTFGSTDALLWGANLRELREAGPVALYENGTVLRNDGVPYHAEVFNHPPLMVRFLSLGGKLSEFTQLPFRFWLRVFCALADLASTLMMLAIVSGAQMPVSPVALFLVAASPISLLISGFHGNTDPIMMALLVLAVYLVNRGGSCQAGAALGLAAGIKIVPLLFAPALALSLPRRKRVVFVAAALGMFFVESLPLVIDHPGLIWSHVFGYNPQAGIWGVPLLVAGFGTEAQAQLYSHLAKGVLLLVLCAFSVWLNARNHRTPIFLQCGILAFVLLTLTPGFGVQYLAWLVPWSCLLSARQAATFHGVGGVFLACYYTRAAHGFPWYLANSAATPVWYGSLIAVGLLCWLVIGWLTLSISQRTLAGAPTSESL